MNLHNQMNELLSYSHAYFADSISRNEQGCKYLFVTHPSNVSFIGYRVQESWQERLGEFNFPNTFWIKETIITGFTGKKKN